MNFMALFTIYYSPFFIFGKGSAFHECYLVADLVLIGLIVDLIILAFNESLLVLWVHSGDINTDDDRFVHLIANDNTIEFLLDRFLFNCDCFLCHNIQIT